MDVIGLVWALLAEMEDKMAGRVKLFVSPSGTQWKVQFEGGSLVSNHTTQEAAIKAARAKVASLPEGACSQILVQGADGQFRTEWTYGKDPFPPRG